ncbi:MAG: sulfite exporter TauE/SafE family protein [Hyphomicrobiales bacterium]
MDESSILLAAGMFVAAMLYSSVGHAGGSAYLALMALFSLPQAVMRPTALALNIIVASLVSARFLLAGVFRWRVLWPFLIGAAPFALLGGSLQLPGHFYKPIVGIVLLIAAARLLLPIGPPVAKDIRDPPVVPAIAGGAAIGLLAGLTGTGGGIFLSPLVLFLGWAETRTISGVAAVFILCNSAAGLLGNLASVGSLPGQLPYYAAAVVAGAALGSTLGVKRLPREMILKALGLVLTVAGLKLIFFS